MHLLNNRKEFHKVTNQVLTVPPCAHTSDEPSELLLIVSEHPATEGLLVHSGDKTNKHRLENSLASKAIAHEDDKIGMFLWAGCQPISLVKGELKLFI